MTDQEKELLAIREHVFQLQRENEILYDSIRGRDDIISDQERLLDRLREILPAYTTEQIH